MNTDMCRACNRRPQIKGDPNGLCDACRARVNRIDREAESLNGIRRDMRAVGIPVRSDDEYSI